MQTHAGPRGRRQRRARGGEPSASGVSPATLASQPVLATSCDPAVQRVREAGGPIDHASYTCECGYQFRAPVSTTVHCPHCGLGQAW